ncbi:histidinol dehydrogenase [Aurantiacibacter atlanticus]|uniref:Histidinol dehydrogenase n=1 Tax=Aurantiacibacter atlanticus TaxID=1648404 RepID=A0A0H4VHK3_9SPHN|nr:histidinol dehydrogenase [Aurantiacibacter atlanticus]AKQ42479.1 histidinol dehydrogenase [Aurantiacibacter atlanticus]MDF1834126.1 histidinol dehydrogenase [Alteraurantiacibacter sp. bin_em_oilr2.035]
MQRLHIGDEDFERKFTRIVNDRRESDETVAHDVREILRKMRQSGDDTLRDMTMRLDKHALSDDPATWRIDADQCRAAHDELAPETKEALQLAADRIRDYHEGQRPQDRDYRDAQNVRLGAKWLPVDAAGLYVPGGRAAYPSSLLMNAIPARVAGVERLVVATPTPRGEINDLVLAAAHVCGIEEIWRIGGAQAIGALAYGTETITPVDVITGPGNAWVAEAKRQLYGVVGIDMVAGPSEILVISDNKSNPDWLAADLLSQAEHDPASQSILITDDAQFGEMVEDALGVLLAQIKTQRTAHESWENHGVILVVDDLATQAPALADRLAAEHVELAVDDPEAIFAKIRHAGSVFLGRHTPEAVGDYVAGPNHVLPTGRRARFASGLSVLDFMKRTSFIELDEAALRTIGPAAAALAEIEGLPAHAASVKVRLK